MSRVPRLPKGKISLDDSALRLLREPPIVRRACLYAVVVGTLLAVLNHGDALLRGGLTAAIGLKIGLNFLVPYAVSTLSSLAAIRQTASRQPHLHQKDE